MAINIAQREKYIVAQARKLGLDPAAVLAIASHEGLSGGIGDGGHAFGPFQMNDAGGVLTGAPASHHSNAYAWSNAGIMQALKAMATVAGGLSGRKAVTAIATRYERPADPAAEIKDAMSVYGTVGNVHGTVTNGGGTTPGGPGSGILSSGGKQFDTGQYKSQLAMTMMQDATTRAQGGTPPDLLTQMAALREAATTKVNNAAGPGGISIPGSGSGLGSRAATIAGKQVGTPYVWGGESKAGFDCSGLVAWTYAKLGINLPRTAAAQGKAGRAVSYKNLQPGDILVENNGDHVVMYAGDGKVVQAPHTGTNVQYSPLSWFSSSQYHARRIVG